MNHEPRYRIYEADERVTALLVQLVQEHSRAFDMRAALDFLLAKDPRYEATKLGEKNSDEVYVKATSAGYPGIPRLFLLYVINEAAKVIVIHSGHLIPPSS